MRSDLIKKLSKTEKVVNNLQFLEKLFQKPIKEWTVSDLEIVYSPAPGTWDKYSDEEVKGMEACEDLDTMIVIFNELMEYHSILYYFLPQFLIRARNQAVDAMILVDDDIDDLSPEEVFERAKKVLKELETTYNPYLIVQYSVFITTRAPSLFPIIKELYEHIICDAVYETSELLLAIPNDTDESADAILDIYLHDIQIPLRVFSNMEGGWEVPADTYAIDYVQETLALVQSKKNIESNGEEGIEEIGGAE